MPPSNCLASSSRSSQRITIFTNPLMADGLSRRITSLSERSAGLSHPNLVKGRLRVAILTTPYSNYGALYIQYWKETIKFVKYIPHNMVVVYGLKSPKTSGTSKSSRLQIGRNFCFHLCSRTAPHLRNSDNAGSHLARLEDPTVRGITLPECGSCDEHHQITIAPC